MKVLMLIALLFTTSSLLSQTIISGYVLDSMSRAPIEYASVRLFAHKDSTVKGGIYTDEKGKFTLKDVRSGDYFLVISLAGFNNKTVETIHISNQPTYFVGNIGLRHTVQELEEVKVVGNIDVLQTGIDKKVYNVDQDLSTRGGTASDALNNIPSVEIDQDGNISLRGDGNVTILIDGRPSSIVGSDKNILASLPANSIERIEVVTNPSAKYDPDGTSGIINIVLKKNKLRGINGLLTGTAGTGNDHQGSTSLSFRNEKFNVFGSYAINYMEGYRNNFSSIEQFFVNDSVSQLEQDRYGTDFKFGHTGRFGMDFYLNNTSTIGFAVVGNAGEHTRAGNQSNYQYNGDGILINEWYRNSKDPEFNKNLDINLNFQNRFKNDRGSLSMNFTHSFQEEDDNGYYEQDYSILNSATAYYNTSYQRIYGNELNNVFTGQADVEYIFPKINSRVETGVKQIIRDQFIDTYSDAYSYEENNYIADTTSNFTYQYIERISSVYGIFGQQIDKFKYQFGLRGEYAFQEPYLISKEQRFTKDYYNLFPSGHIKYSLTKVVELSLGYSRRINRPSSRNLNPFTSYADPYNLRRGNPDLSPEYIDSYDAGLQWQKKKMDISINGYYRMTKDVIQRVKLFYPDNTSAATFENISESQSAGVEVVGVLKPYKIWRSTVSFNGNYIQFSDDSELTNWNNSGFNWNISVMSSVDVLKNGKIQFNGRYMSPRISAQGKVQPRAFFDLSAEKGIGKDHWTVGLRLSDIFNTRGFSYLVDQPSVRQESYFKWQSRRLYLTLTYKFGKLEMTKSKGENGGDGMDF